VLWESPQPSRLGHALRWPEPPIGCRLPQIAACMPARRNHIYEHGDGRFGVCLPFSTRSGLSSRLSSLPGMIASPQPSRRTRTAWTSSQFAVTAKDQVLDAVVSDAEAVRGSEFSDDHDVLHEKLVDAREVSEIFSAPRGRGGRQDWR